MFIHSKEIVFHFQPKKKRMTFETTRYNIRLKILYLLRLRANYARVSPRLLSFRPNGIERSENMSKEPRARLVYRFHETVVGSEL